METNVSKMMNLIENHCAEGIVISIRSVQEKLVRDIVSLSDEQLDLLERFVESIKDTIEE